MPYYNHRSRRYYRKRKNNYEHVVEPYTPWSEYLLPFVRGAASAIPYGKLFEGLFAGTNEVLKESGRRPSVRSGTHTSDWRNHGDYGESYEEIIRPGWGKY